MGNILYLGPQSWSRRIKKLLPYKILFNSAAKTHDDGYALLKKIPYDWEQFDRETLRGFIDLNFYSDMRKAIITSNRNIVYRFFASIFACIYYTFVRVFGKYYSKYNPDSSLTPQQIDSLLAIY